MAEAKLAHQEPAEPEASAAPIHSDAHFTANDVFHSVCERPSCDSDAQDDEHPVAPLPDGEAKLLRLPLYVLH